MDVECGAGEGIGEVGAKVLEIYIGHMYGRAYLKAMRDFGIGIVKK